MIMLLGGRGEAYDLTLIFFGIAVFFGLLFFILWFPAWRRRRLEEKREAEYMVAYMENTAIEAGSSAERTESQLADAETGESYHKSQ